MAGRKLESYIRKYGEVKGREIIRSMAQLFVHPDTPAAEIENLEKWRVKIEGERGPTDPTRFFTSMRPLHEQEWLVNHDPRAWFEGLPEFIQEAVLEQLKQEALDGRLDDQRDGLIQLWFSRRKLGRS